MGAWYFFASRNSIDDCILLEVDMGKLTLKDLRKEVELHEEFIDRVPQQMECMERQLKWYRMFLIIAFIALVVIGIIGVIK